MKIRSLDNPDDLLGVFEDQQGDIYISISQGARDSCIRIGGVHSGHQIPKRLHWLLHQVAREFERFSNVRYESDAVRKEEQEEPASTGLT